MNRLLGWLIVIAAAVYVVVIYPIVLLSDGSAAKENFEFYRIIGICQLIALVFGITKIRSKKTSKITPVAPFEIKINSKINTELLARVTLALGFRAILYNVMLIVLSMLISFIVFKSTNERIQSDSILPCAALALFICSPYFSYLRIRLTQKTTEIMNEPVQYTLNNESVHISNSNINATVAWSQLTNATELNRFFLLYQANGEVIVIDKKQLDPNQLPTLSYFIRALPVYKD